MAGTGKLIIRTYVANMLIPLGDANVTITKSNGGENNILAFRVTDSEGKTPEVEIITPDIAESRTDQNTGTPFTVVDIAVEKEGYEITYIRDAQIFSDRLSEQNVEMIPLPEYAAFDEYYNVFTVTPQNL